MFLFCQCCKKITLNTVCARSKTTIWFKDLAEELEKFNGVGGIVNRKK